MVFAFKMPFSFRCCVLSVCLCGTYLYIWNSLRKDVQIGFSHRQQSHFTDLNGQYLFIVFFSSFRASHGYTNTFNSITNPFDKCLKVLSMVRLFVISQLLRCTFGFVTYFLFFVLLFLSLPFPPYCRISRKGLYISDVPIHDATRDLVLLSEQFEAGYKLTRNLEVLTDKLQQTYRELESEKQKTDR